MDDDSKRLGLSIWDNAVLATELGLAAFSPGGLPTQPLSDDAGCQAVVQQVEAPDWVLDAAQHRQEELIELGNDPQAVPVAEQAEIAPPPDLAPPAEPMGPY